MAADESIDEPTMIGASPEDRRRAQQRKKRLGIATAAFVVLIAVGVGIALLPPTVNHNLTVDPVASRCAAGGSFTCTVTLDAKTGTTISPAMIKSVQINYTSATMRVQGGASTVASGAVTVIASVPLAPMENCPGDIGCSLRPPTTGDVTVFLTDGTSVSVVLGAGGIKA